HRRRARALRGPPASELRGQRHHASLGRGHPLLPLRARRRLHRLSRRARRAGGPLLVHARARAHRARSDALTGPGVHYVDTSTGRTYPLTEARWRADNGHYLNLAPGPGLRRRDIETSRRSIWRYARALLVGDEHAVTLGEGWTPLLDGTWHGAPVHYKLEF